MDEAMLEPRFLVIVSLYTGYSQKIASEKTQIATSLKCSKQ